MKETRQHILARKALTDRLSAARYEAFDLTPFDLAQGPVSQELQLNFGAEVSGDDLEDLLVIFALEMKQFATD